MNLLERAIAAVAPQWSASRARHRALTMHYDAAVTGRRAGTLRASRSDADAAGRHRLRMAWYARDMVRNTPFATQAQAVISGAVVGDGIIPKVTIGRTSLNSDMIRGLKDRGLALIERHFDSTAIDRHGRLNLYGLQRLVMNTVVDAGECLVRIHRSSDLPDEIELQLEVLEPDHLDEAKWGLVAGGGEIRDGIEYDGEGRRLAYWLFPRHPGADTVTIPHGGTSERVEASEILHVFRQDRPGQNRGVTWFAPAMMRLQDLADFEDAQLRRQEIAACFAAFRVLGPDGKATTPMPEEIVAGMIVDISSDEDVKFASPPGVEAYDEFTRSVLRSVAAGMGISYEALTGDLAQVNFSSARMGRLQMDQNVSAWQWLMLIPQFLQPVASLFVDEWQRLDQVRPEAERLPDETWASIRLAWVPPRRVIVDPTREFSALREAVRSGFASRQQVVRQLGIDPERLLEEQAQDRDEADRLGLPFDSDPRADVSRQSKAEEADDDKISARDAARAIGVTVDDLRGLVEDMRRQEQRKRK